MENILGKVTCRASVRAERANAIEPLHHKANISNPDMIITGERRGFEEFTRARLRKCIDSMAGLRNRIGRTSSHLCRDSPII